MIFGSSRDTFSFVNFAYLVDLFPPHDSLPCPRCGGNPYVFGYPADAPEREVLACSSCGFLFHYPCQKCGRDTANTEERDNIGFVYSCVSCGHRYRKEPGWLERPPDFQKKLQAYVQKQFPKEERALQALR